MWEGRVYNDAQRCYAAEQEPCHALSCPLLSFDVCVWLDSCGGAGGWGEGMSNDMIVIAEAAREQAGI